MPPRVEITEYFIKQMGTYSHKQIRFSSLNIKFDPEIANFNQIVSVLFGIEINNIKGLIVGLVF